MPEATTMPPPRLPQGNASTFRGISDNFAFHASPERYIEQQLAAISSEDLSIISARKPVRAKILNRNVAVLSSYSHVTQVLAGAEQGSDATAAYQAEPAYRELMTQFFPPPNLLLAHPRDHPSMRKAWEERMAADVQPIQESAPREVAHRFFAGLAASGPKSVDLYDTMKTLSWEIMLGVFLNLKSSDKDFQIFESLHEDLLRGQFSLLPISVNVGFWQSPRKRGIEARKKVQQLIAQRLELKRDSCPFADAEKPSHREELRDHLLMFTSSLAVKGMASLLTAFFLNLYASPLIGADGIRQLAALDSSERRQKMESILLETERLSPPIVGVMRRAVKETIVKNESPQLADVLLPAGWDVWIYFVGAGRDGSVYGDEFDLFKPDRFSTNPAPPQPPAFGLGSKTCLGRDFIQATVISIAEVCLLDLEMTFDISGTVPRGVQAWLGWQRESEVGLEEWAAHVKQLPTQRPSTPVHVRLSVGNG